MIKIDVVCTLGDENQVTPYQNIPSNYKFKKTITAPRPPINKHRGEPTTYNGINAPVPAIGEINGYRAVSGQADTLTCIWRYRYNGDTEEKWFTSGEAHNLACNPNGEIGCPGTEPGDPPTDVASNRGWDTSGVPGGTLDDVYTSSELQTLANQWELKGEEIDNADLEHGADAFDPSDILGFGSDEIDTMINQVLNYVS